MDLQEKPVFRPVFPHYELQSPFYLPEGWEWFLSALRSRPGQGSSSRGSREMRNKIQTDPAGLKTIQTFLLRGIFIPVGTRKDFRGKGRVWALWSWKSYREFGIWEPPGAAVPSHLSDPHLRPFSISCFPHFHLSLSAFLPTVTQAQLSSSPINPRKTPAFSAFAARLLPNKSGWD